MQDSMVTQMDLLDDQLSPRGNFLTVQDKDRVIREQRARIDELNQQLANAQQEVCVQIQLLCITYLGLTAGTASKEGAGREE
jgi:2,3-bisphosphoglycerate-independent phosphoglycerate mutase